MNHRTKELLAPLAASLMVSGAVLAGFACGSTAPAKQAANVTHDVGVAGAEYLEVECVEPMRRATTQAEVDAVIAKGCRDAVNAYEGLRLAHQTIVAVVKATDAGQCVGVSKVSRECNVAGAYVDLSKAAQEWAAAFERIKEAKR